MGNPTHFSRLSQGTLAASQRTMVHHNTVETQRTSMFLWALHGGRSYLDVLGASLSHFYRG